jgi:arylsulfatase A-like enzyme
MPPHNILFVMSDHTNSAAAAPDSPCRTPNLGRLARDGLRFARCYTTNAVCSPARASLMTGTYPSTHGVWDCTHTQRPAWVDVDPSLTFWSQRLAEAGYATGYFGKWHVEQSGRLDRFGWQEHDTRVSALHFEPLAGTEVVVRKAGYRDYLLAAAAADAQETPCHPAFEAGIDFIRRNADRGRPFCCFVSTDEPHDPYIPPQHFLDAYDVESTPVSPTLDAQEVGGKPEIVARMRAVWAALTWGDWRRLTAAYRAVVTFLDHETGRIIDALQQAGVYDSTIVVVTADHGDMLGGHGLATKGVGTAYEEVYNVPLIVRAPGIRAGDDARHVVSLVDVAPTLLDLCGLDPLEQCHGRSLRAVLEGASDPADWQDAHAEFFGQRFVYTQRITWHGDWKYIFSPGGIDELYNLADDPHEVCNLADDPAHRSVLTDMCRRMWRKMREIGDESLFHTHYATLRTAPVGPLSAEAP